MISSCNIFNPSHMSGCEQRLSFFLGKSGIVRATLSVFSALLLNNIDLFYYQPTYVVSLGPGYNVRSLSDHRTTICDFCRWSIDILTFEIFPLGESDNQPNGRPTVYIFSYTSTYSPSIDSRRPGGRPHAGDLLGVKINLYFNI